MEALRERFGKYHVLEKIAQGGMAEVYKVKTVGIAGFEKVQALKRILPSSAREGRFIRSFIDEARIAVELTHRNIVQVFDFGKADGELFLAMELIEGKDLRTAMGHGVARDAMPSIPIAAHIIAEVAAGLDYAHRKTDGYGGPLGIVHCDVSPSNVMVSSDGYVKILDFGIARATFASALERRRLRGKPRYMAPEQTLGEPPTPAADVFALGIIAWELLTGLPLYHGPDLRSILEAVRHTEPPRIDRIKPAVPREIVDAIAVALAREPAQRGTAADLAAACARTAMQSSARQLAAWLAELDSRPSQTAIPWQPEATSVSVPPAGPPSRPSLTASLAGLPPAWPSVTMSLADVPVPRADLGAGTPGFPDDASIELPTEPVRPGDPPAAATRQMRRFAGEVRRPAPTPTPVTTVIPATPVTAVIPVTPVTAVIPATPTTVIPATPVTAVTPIDEAPSRTPGPAPRGPTSTLTPTPTPAPRTPASTLTPTARMPAPPAIPPTPTVVSAPARPADDDGDEEATTATRTPRYRGEPWLNDPPPTEPFTRPSLMTFAEPAVRAAYEGVPATPRPTLVRLDEEATHRAAPPAVAAGPPDDTSYDDLDVELSADLVVEPLRDEPIDDDLGALQTGLPGERRRTVVVAGALQGAPGDVLRPIARSLGELAYQRGGVVTVLDDDALVVAFGLEVAGEDDVAVAMGWALDACALARDATPELGDLGDGGQIALRIGARTGVATAPSAPGDGAPAQLPHDAIDEARALAREASPDRPLFVGGAGRLTSALYALREVPAPRRIARRSRVIEVIGPRGFAERDRARLERRGRFVGRALQLAELQAWFHRAVAADRRLAVTVQGAAGTGKSRLIAELIARLAESAAPVRVITAAASPAGRLAPFSLIVELYQAALELPPARGRGARGQLVQHLLHLLSRARVPSERARAVASDLDRAMELRDGVGVGAPEIADLRPRISAGLAVFRGALADRRRPLVTVVEDVHQADSASLDVLRHALEMPALAPELLVLTARPDGAPPPPSDAVISIGDLVGGELRALIADRLGERATPLNIAAVLARGGGNPLFVEELAQAVRDAGAAGEDIPASARDVVSARVERLSAKARSALRFAAVLGASLRARLLEELLGEDSLAAELDELVDAGFLVRADDAAGSSEGELAFARGLVREVVYESLSARAQRESHARVGRLLASRYLAGREEPPAVIGEHLERGGEPAGAAAFWLRAGRLALTASDAAAAVACFSRTLGLERELGAAPPTAPSRARRREALAGRDTAHRLQGELTADPHDLDELARLCDGEPARLADVAIRRAQRLLRFGELAAAHAATVTAEDHAIAARDRRLRGEALRVRGEILERQGRFDEALACVGAARELFHALRAVADEMAAMVGRGRIHLLRADYEAARDAYRPVLAMIETTRDPWLERVVTNHVAVIEMCLGNFARAMQSAARSLELCRRYGDRAREGDGLSVTGIILLEVGLHDRAAAVFVDALDLLGRTSSRWSRADCLIYAGTCEVRRGRPAGLALLDEAVLEARRLGARYLEANALIARSGARLLGGELAAAADDARDGTAAAAAATLVGYEIQGLARHALALSRLGGHGDAGALVHRALALLDRQRYLEGSEEEVLAACAEVLDATGAGDRAAAVRARGRESALRKLDALADPEWIAAYRAIPEVAALLG